MSGWRTAVVKGALRALVLTSVLIDDRSFENVMCELAGVRWLVGRAVLSGACRAVARAAVLTWTFKGQQGPN